MHIRHIQVKLIVASPSNTKITSLKCPMSLSAKYAEVNAAPHEAILDQNPIQPTEDCILKRLQ